MGVKNLFQFLRRYQREVHIADYVKNKSVGIDIFWFIHKSKGDFFQLHKYLLPIIKNAKETHCVFDGTPSPEKKRSCEEKNLKRAELLESIQRIEDFLKYPFHQIKNEDRRHICEYLKELKMQAWQPSPLYINEVKLWLKSQNSIIHYAVNEADYLLVELQKKLIIQTIITNDSDLLVLGSSHIIRPINPYLGAILEKRRLCEIFGFTAQQWDDFMYLCSVVKDNDVLLAYSLISVYKELEYVFEKYDAPLPPVSSLYISTNEVEY